MSFSERLKECRKENKLSQTDLGKRKFQISLNLPNTFSDRSPPGHRKGVQVTVAFLNARLCQSSGNREALLDFFLLFFYLTEHFKPMFWLSLAAVELSG